MSPKATGRATAQARLRTLELSWGIVRLPALAAPAGAHGSQHISSDPSETRVSDCMSRSHQRQVGTTYAPLPPTRFTCALDTPRMSHCHGASRAPPIQPRIIWRSLPSYSAAGASTETSTHTSSTICGAYLSSISHFEKSVTPARARARSAISLPRPNVTPPPPTHASEC
eukprot:scaffold1928_cov381-Prasinococcus_capsulatus_cf.AAC.18